MQSQVTPMLRSALSGMSPNYRSTTMAALSTRPRVQGRWTGSGGSGCFWVIATMGVTGMSRKQFMKDPTGNSAKTFGISADRVRQVYQEWDALTPDQLDAFMASVRAEVEAGVRAVEHQPSFVRRTFQTARELVYA